MHPYTVLLIQWNRFRCIKFDPREYFLGVDVTIRTRLLSLPELSADRLERLHLIDDLHQKGLTNRDIADYLNERGMRSPRGGFYSPKLVWVTLKKFLLRKERMKDTTYTVDRIYPAKRERVSY